MHVSTTTARAIAEAAPSTELLTAHAVPEFLGRSLWQQPVFHTGKSTKIDSVVANGADVRRVKDTYYGQAFYTAVSPDFAYGDKAIALAVRSERPLLLGESDGIAARDAKLGAELARLEPRFRRIWPGINEYDRAVAELTGLTSDAHSPYNKAEIREALLQLGYDSVVWAPKGKVTWVLGLRNDGLRILSPLDVRSVPE